MTELTEFEQKLVKRFKGRTILFPTIKESELPRWRMDHPDLKVIGRFTIGNQRNLIVQVDA